MDLVHGAGGPHDAAYLRDDGRAAVKDLLSHLRRDVFAYVHGRVLRKQHCPVVPALGIHQSTVARLGAFDGTDRNKLVQSVHDDRPV